jgi:hypothetical protein
MFNRLQRFSSLRERRASFEPANYAPFSAGQFGAFVAKELTKELGTVLDLKETSDTKVFIEGTLESRYRGNKVGLPYRVWITFKKGDLEITVQSGEKIAKIAFKINSYIGFKQKNFAQIAEAIQEMVTDFAESDYDGI